MHSFQYSRVRKAASYQLPIKNVFKKCFLHYKTNIKHINSRNEHSLKVLKSDQCPIVIIEGSGGPLFYQLVIPIPI